MLKARAEPEIVVPPPALPPIEYKEPRVKEEEPPAKGPECSDNMCKLAAKGKRFRRIAESISFRIRDYRSNRITYEEADRAAGYVLTGLRRMRNAERLMRFLPDTSVEILRSVHERRMDRKEGERMAYYLYRIVAWIKMKSRRDFDEYLSNLVGREWKDVKPHPQEGFTWQGEKAFYEKHDVPDLKTALHLHRYLKVERYRKHFQDRFRFYGRHPPAPQ